MTRSFASCRDMRNEDKRFTPENSTGPLSGKLAPLRPVKVESHENQRSDQIIDALIQRVGQSKDRVKSAMI